MNKAEVTPLCLSIPEASKYFGISQFSLREGIKTNQIPYVKSGKKYLIKRLDLETLVNSDGWQIQIPQKTSNTETTILCAPPTVLAPLTMSKNEYFLEVVIPDRKKQKHIIYQVETAVEKKLKGGCAYIPEIVLDGFSINIEETSYAVDILEQPVLRETKLFAVSKCENGKTDRYHATIVVNRHVAEILMENDNSTSIEINKCHALLYLFASIQHSLVADPEAIGFVKHTPCSSKQGHCYRHSSGRMVFLPDGAKDREESNT